MYAGSIKEVNITQIQTGYNVSYQKCDEPTCDVMLFWSSHGALTDGQDFVFSCGLCETDTYYCTNHIEDAECYICETPESEEENNQKKRQRICLELEK